MKHFQLLLVGLIAATSCNKELKQAPVLPSNELVNLNVACELPYESTITKAATQGNESKLTSIHTFIFNGDNLEQARALTSSELSAKSATFKVRANATYSIYVIANAPSGLATDILATTSKTTFLAKTFTLSNDAVTTNGPIMKGTAASVAVTTSDVTAPSISLSRYVGRVELKSIQNALPAALGAITVKRAYLCNVVGNQNVAGNASISTWLNRDGAKTGHAAKTPIAASTDSDAPSALLYKEFAASTTISAGATNTGIASYFYGYANSYTNKSSGFNATFVPSSTTLMVVANIKGTDYYYPIALERAMTANSNYSIALKIMGYGNTETDPFIPISKVNLISNITISNWTDGASLTPEI